MPELATFLRLIYIVVLFDAYLTEFAMETFEIELINQKALKLLQDMEELNLIKVLRKTPGLSSLRKQIRTQMSEDEIDQQLLSIREEWTRDIS